MIRQQDFGHCGSISFTSMGTEPSKDNMETIRGCVYAWINESHHSETLAVDLSSHGKVTAWQGYSTWTRNGSRSLPFHEGNGPPRKFEGEDPRSFPFSIWLRTSTLLVSGSSFEPSQPYHKTKLRTFCLRIKSIGIYGWLS